jgi:tRNA pseudouridine55 synthase
MSKTYRSRFRLGARSDTDDADGTIAPAPSTVAPDLAAVAARLAEFVGTIEQVPPAFSAAKIAGRRAYDLARRGEEVVLAPRPVRVHALTLLDYGYPLLDVEVHCGKGTYIRSLARDLGERLGCGAYVETLRRTRVGPFRVQDALSLDADADNARRRLLPVETAVAELPRVVLPNADGRRLCQGQAVECTNTRSGGGPIAVFDAGGRLLAVAECDPTGNVLRPAKVLVFG